MVKLLITCIGSLGQLKIFNDPSRDCVMYVHDAGQAETSSGPLQQSDNFTANIMISVKST